MKIFKVKNKTNWLVTIVLGFGLLLVGFIVFIFMPLSVIFQENSFWFALFSYASNVVPYLIFFSAIFYFWLWNTFGKTILEYDAEKIIITKKYKLFSKPKTYYRAEIQKIDIEDFEIERTKYNVRYNFSWSGSTYSIIFIIDNTSIRIVDWITYEKAKTILSEIQ
jgi:hypothetical protein